MAARHAQPQLDPPLTVLGAPVGLGVLVALTLWLIYRIARGWLRLLDRQPMYV